MAWIRLFEQDAADGEDMGEIFEMSFVPDVGDRLAVHSHDGDVVLYEVLGRTFEVALDEEGDTDGESRVTLDVERLELVADDDPSSQQEQ